MEIGLRFVNRILTWRLQTHLSPGTAAPFNGGFEMPSMQATSGTWNSTLIKAVRAPFDDQVTMATMYLSGDTKLWWRTRYEDVLEGRCEINAWEELNRKLKYASNLCLGTLHGLHESP